MSNLFESSAFDTLRHKADMQVESSPEAALDTYNRALVAASKDKEKVYALGGIITLLMKASKKDEATKFIKKLLAIEPHNAWATKRLKAINTVSKSDAISKVDKVLDGAVSKDEISNKLDQVHSDNKDVVEIDEVVEDIDDSTSDAEVDAIINEIDSQLSAKHALGATDATKETLAKGKQPEADKGVLSSILSVAAEVTGLPGLFRSGDALWEWMFANDKPKYEKAIKEMYIMDLLDFVFWIGAIISVGIAAATGAAAGAGIGALPAGGVAAVSSFLVRVAGKKVGLKVSLGLVFRYARRAIAKNWYKAFKKSAVIKNNLRAIDKLLKGNGFNDRARTAIIKSFNNTTHISETAFKTGAKTRNWLGVKIKIHPDSSTAIYKAINNMPLNTKLRVINKLELGGKALAGLSNAGIKAPLNVAEAAFVQGFKKNALTSSIIKKYNTAQLVEVGVIFGDLIAEYSVGEFFPEAADKISASINKLFETVDVFKLVVANALWDFRTSDWFE